METYKLSELNPGTLMVYQHFNTAEGKSAPDMFILILSKNTILFEGKILNESGTHGSQNIEKTLFGDTLFLPTYIPCVERYERIDISEKGEKHIILSRFWEHPKRCLQLI